MSDLIITRPDQENPREVRTEGGLIVPASAITYEQETWIKEDIKRFDRTIHFLKERKLEMIVVCQECHQPLRPVEREDGRVVLQCKHKERVLKRDV